MPRASVCLSAGPNVRPAVSAGARTPRDRISCRATVSRVSRVVRRRTAENAVSKYVAVFGTRAVKTAVFLGGGLNLSVGVHEYRRFWHAAPATLIKGAEVNLDRAALVLGAGSGTRTHAGKKPTPNDPFPASRRLGRDNDFPYSRGERVRLKKREKKKKETAASHLQPVCLVGGRDRPADGFSRTTVVEYSPTSRCVPSSRDSS